MTVIFHFIYGMSSFPLTFIFFRGVETTDQYVFVSVYIIYIYICKLVCVFSLIMIMMMMIIIIVLCNDLHMCYLSYVVISYFI